MNSLGGGANETARNQEEEKKEQEEEEETCNAKSLILSVPFRDRRKKLICRMLDVRWWHRSRYENKMHDEINFITDTRLVEGSYKLEATCSKYLGMVFDFFD